MGLQRDGRVSRSWAYRRNSRSFYGPRSGSRDRPRAAACRSCRRDFGLRLEAGGGGVDGYLASALSSAKNAGSGPETAAPPSACRDLRSCGERAEGGLAAPRIPSRTPQLPAPDCSLRTAFASICRTRSQVTLNLRACRCCRHPDRTGADDRAAERASAAPSRSCLSIRALLPSPGSLRLVWQKSPSCCHPSPTGRSAIGCFEIFMTRLVSSIEMSAGPRSLDRRLAPRFPRRAMTPESGHRLDHMDRCGSSAPGRH